MSPLTQKKDKQNVIFWDQYSPRGREYRLRLCRSVVFCQIRKTHVVLAGSQVHTTLSNVSGIMPLLKMKCPRFPNSGWRPRLEVGFANLVNKGEQPQTFMFTFQGDGRKKIIWKTGINRVPCFSLYHFLKTTLFNIMEARLKNCWIRCLCCIMMFRWINTQPGIHKLWHWCSHYQDIYDWISPFNKPSGLWFILTQQSMGGNEYGKSSHF